MRPRAGGHDTTCEGHGGLGDFLRSLLAGIPWSDRAEVLETLRFAAPRSGALRVVNANGKTRVVGEDRDDIEVRLQKVARAENEEEVRRVIAMWLAPDGA